MEDDFADFAAFAAAVEAAEQNNPQQKQSHPPRPQQPKPQLLPRPGVTASTTTSSGPSVSSAQPLKVQQPKPQVIPGARSGPSAILVSPRQKGNPILNNVRSLPWEYSDIPADYVLGNTTCALFLSLKYHRLHPEYIYSRIRQVGQKYNLRILLTMVDITNHEEALKELSKTSLVNNLTLILCWSAAEAGRYLELYKSCEHTAPTAIRAAQATSYADKVVEFVTVPRSINKTDALGLVSSFGSVRAGVNARPEELSLMAGWGDAKVQRWTSAVRENFRVKRTARRTAGGGISSISREPSGRHDVLDETDFETRPASTSTPSASNTPAPIPIGTVPSRLSTMTKSASVTPNATTPNVLGSPGLGAASVQRGPTTDEPDPFADDEEALLTASEAASQPQRARNISSKLVPSGKPPDAPLSQGIMDALAKYRQER